MYTHRLGVRFLPLISKPLTHDRRSQPTPRHKHEVSIRDVLAAEVRTAALLEVRIDDAKDAFDLVAVAVETRRQVLLRVVLHIADLVSMVAVCTQKLATL